MSFKNQILNVIFMFILVLKVNHYDISYHVKVTPDDEAINALKYIVSLGTL